MNHVPYNDPLISNPSSATWVQSLWLSIQGHLTESFKRAMMLTVAPLLMSLVFLGLSVMLLHRLNVIYPDHKTPLSAGGVLMVQWMEHLKPQPKKRLEGVRFYVQGQGMAQDTMTQGLQEEGGILVQHAQQADVVLKHGHTGWLMQSEDKPLLLLLGNDVRRAGTNTQGVVQLKPSPKQHDDKMRTVKQYINMFLALSILAPLFLFVWTSSSSMANDVHRGRSEGAFESLILAKSPFWVYLLGQSVGRALYVGLFSGLLIGVAGWMVAWPHPVTWITTMVSLSMLSLVMNMWGGIQVLWFHHRYSYALGALVLNPMISPVPLLLMLLFQGQRLVNMVQQSLQKQADVLPILHTTPELSLSLMLVTVMVALISVVLLSWAIEKRLGARRTGLAKV